MDKNTNLINLGISPEIIKPIIDAHIKAMITEALGGTEDLVQKAVDSFLHTKVDKDSGKATTSAYNSTTLLDYYFNTLLVDSVQDAIKECLSESTNQIKEAVKRSLLRRKGDKFADAIMDCIIGTFDSNWRSRVELTLSRMSDE